MGKKPQGAALRAKKRAREAVEELQERQAEVAASQTVRTQPNEQLFVLDTCGKTVPVSERPSLKKKKKPKVVPDKEEAQVEKLIQKHGGDANKLVELAQKGKQVLERRLRTRSLRGRTQAAFDLWEDKEDSSSNSDKPAVSSNEISSGVGSTLGGTAPPHVAVKALKIGGDARKMVAIDVAKSGQSYHPDPKAHKAVINDAVKVEVARQEALRYNETSVSQGLSKETRALLVGDTDSENETSEEEEEEDQSIDLAVGPLVKRTDKKTRAQRNKEKRLRQEKAALEKRRKEKKLLNTLSEIPRYSKEIKREVRKQQERNEKKKGTRTPSSSKGKDLDKKISRENPIKATTFPVALSCELKSSLRTIRPKGSLATDRLNSLMDRNLVPKPTNNPKHHRGKRRKKNVKGRRNNEGVGSNFVVKG